MIKTAIKSMEENMDQVTKAVELFGQGYMCSQAVFAAFSEQYGVTEKQALQIGGCFGKRCSPRSRSSTESPKNRLCKSAAASVAG